MTTVPSTARAIRDRIRNLTGNKEEGSPENRRRFNEVASTVVGQMLPAGVVKGGAAMYFRFGQASRFSMDLDAAHTLAVEDFKARFEEKLGEGWGGFTGTLAERPRAAPPDVPGKYVMQPFSIRLSYRGSTRPETVDFELSADELGSTESAEKFLADDALRLFHYLGLPTPDPVPLIAVPHQVAQKLHACTAPGNDRAHDLVDIQLLLRNGEVNKNQLADITKRLFGYRRAHLWPARIQPTPLWPSLYAAALEAMDPNAPASRSVLPSVDEAVKWVNDVLDELAVIS